MQRLTAEVNTNAIIAHFDAKLEAMQAHIDIQHAQLVNLLTIQGTHPLDETIAYATDDEDWDR